MRQFSVIYLFIVFLVILLSSCKITKYVPEGKYLLDKNSIFYVKDSNHVFASTIDPDEINSILKQKPNRRIILGYRFHLRLYNLSNQNRIDSARIRKELKAEEKNSKIRLKNERKLNKDPNSTPKLMVNRRQTFGERLRSAGEEPVVIDQVLVQKSTRQISVFLINKGFFDNKVQDSIDFNKKRSKTADVIYEIQLGEPFVYRNIFYQVNDTVLMKYLDSIKKESLLKLGSNFDTDVLDDERKRITNYLQNKGYHYFNKEFIYFRADTSNGTHAIDLTLGIQNYKQKAEFADTIIEKKHRQYKVDKIDFEIYTDYQKINHADTTKIHYKDISIGYFNKLLCREHLLYNSLTFKKGELFNKSSTESTYKKLAGLGLFNAISIQFDTIPSKKSLLAKIKLEPAKSQTFILSADGTNNEGFFGLQGSMSYAHSNIFRGAEKLSISMTGGLETQLLVTGNEDDNSNDLNEVLFNTIELGPRLSLLFPKYLLINKLKFFKDHSNSKTELTASLNYQQRPDFTRTIQEMSFGWIIHEKRPFTWHINPMLLSAIDIKKEADFEQQIIDLNDQFIAASFQDHIIAGGLYSFEYNGQNDHKVRNVFYLKTIFELGGGILYQLHKAMNKPYDNTATNSYNLLGIRYAHFQKLSLDLRYYVSIGKRGKLVYRLAGGIGIPRNNLKEALPFEKSFYSGGANGMRAWRARSLGPGSFLDDDNSYDKIGDVQVEANFEARFPLISWVEGAFFIDAGNIWLLNDDPIRPGGQFKKEEFLREIAIGSGLGLRMDLDFFIIRMDLAMPMKNPSLTKNERWIFQGNYNERKDFYKLQFNLGIGYPF